jgi:hypothetical protein
MSAVNSSTFANRKPKLDGVLTKSGTTIVGTSAGNTGLSGIQGGEVLRGTIIVTPTEAVNLVFLKFSQYATQDSNIQIREGGDVIATVDAGATGTRTINIVLEDVSVATHTYSCYTQFDTIVYQYGNASGGTVFVGVTANMDDTHSTKNTNVISG